MSVPLVPEEAADTDSRWENRHMTNELRVDCLRVYLVMLALRGKEELAQWILSIKIFLHAFY